MRGEILLIDPAAAEDDVAVVEDDGLAGRDGDLRLPFEIGIIQPPDSASGRRPTKFPPRSPRRLPSDARRGAAKRLPGGCGQGRTTWMMTGCSSLAATARDRGLLRRPPASIIVTR